MTRHPRLARLLVATACTLLAACGGPTQTVVLAASSVAPAIEAAALTLAIPTAVVGAGSQVLVAQVEAGAPVDLVLLAEADLAARLTASGLPEPVVLASTTLSLVARPGLEIDFEGALADDGLSIVLADQDVPLGAASRRALTLAGPGTLERVLARAVSFEDAAASVHAKLESGEADLAVVYTANATTAARAGRLVVLGALSPDVRVDILAQAATDAGRRLLDGLRGPEGQQVLRDFGYLTPA